MSESFESQLHDDETGIISDLDDDGGPALVAFGGLHTRSGMGMPPFEFFGLLRDLDCSKVFVRDLDQVFYQGGVRGLGTSIPEVAGALRSLLAGHSPVAFVGNSSGGFGALVFGALVGVDRVVAFAPETFVSRTLRFIYRDDRWPDEIEAMYRIPGLERRYLNAKRALAKDNGRTRYDIYFPKWNKLDARHALRMSSHRRLTLHPNSSKSHGVIRELRDTGALKPLITELIERR